MATEIHVVTYRSQRVMRTRLGWVAVCTCGWRSADGLPMVREVVDRLAEAHKAKGWADG